MNDVLERSIDESIREELTWTEKWESADRGLIFCWERGRKLRAEKPGLAEQAERGELIPLWWEGGVERKLMSKKAGSFFYLATWQGLRNENLKLNLRRPTVLTCTRTNQRVVFEPLQSLQVTGQTK